MGFTDKFLHALNSTDLRDDAFHYQTESLKASAIADKSARNIGSLLARTKYADTLSHQFEDSSGNLPTLRKAWLAIVTEKGAARGWVKAEDISIAPILYRRVADFSLAHYLDGKCEPCGGTGSQGVEKMFAICPECKGTREAKLPPMTHYENRIVLDMLGELIALESAHSGVANYLLRREA